MFSMAELELCDQNSAMRKTHIVKSRSSASSTEVGALAPPRSTL